MKWKVTAASARGSAHLRSGLPNQDACEFRNGDRSSALRAVLAVSDGHGGARHFRSQVGSALAVHTAIRVLYDSLDAALAEAGAGLSMHPVEDALPPIAVRMVEEWRTAVRSDFENNPFTAQELDAVEAAEGAPARASVEQDPLLAYGATLLSAAVTDAFVLCLQLGDGDILAVDYDGRTLRPIAADGRLVANQTTSLCQAEAEREFRYAVLREFPALLLVSTDGYANSFRSDADFLQIGRDYLDLVRRQGVDALAEELPQILKGASEEGSGDDITLGVLHRVASPQPQAPVIPQPVPMPAAERPRARKLSGVTIGAAGLLLAGAAFVGYSFWWPLCCSPPRPAVAAGVRDKKPSPQKQQAPPKAAAAAPVTGRTAWTLEVSAADGARLELTPGDHILYPALDPAAEASSETYAEVRAAADGGVELVNCSDDPWTVQRGGRKGVDPPVGKGQSVTLAAKMRITFRSGVTAIVRQAPASRKSPPEPPQD
jgi:serine/threonine protein phosphatase PrpC